ncbi:MAG: gliding motility protein GldL [Bacteroidetes bacterium]|jgi:gliding motility-associated protein GldL|nr:gliding motility protein GldL [Bacteroidota bacterium]MBP7256027.1 gliding motility protein GldL [Chitinophagales bacterium]MBK7505275.1 gliding motility protein GldL [Bacteroidota bacterium]MBK9634541.1 gliding motility protein GldL [Bacteroidota bacterium]MBL0078531.1 gliding motility protein GldL [Bacteroidota bacterium]
MAAPFFKTKGFKYGKNLLFGVGAAVVIVGALLKILHHPLANIALIIGMSVEAGIFAFSGIVPPEPDYYWDKIYPGLDTYDGDVKAVALDAAGDKKSLTSELDKMLEKAKIDQGAITRLGENLGGLSANIGKLTSVADTSLATNEFANNAKEAAAALSKVKTSYEGAASAMGLMANASDATGKYHEQVQSATKNLASLNAVYELELQDTNTHLKAMNKFIGSLSTAMSHLEGSVDDAARYKESMAKLSVNVEKLNGVYGNMLTAMRS